MIRGRATTTIAIAHVGMFSDGHAKGSKSLIMEMAKRLRKTNSPQDVMQALLRDPERLTRLLHGGVMPERVADWLGGLGSKFSKSRKRIFWIGGLVGVMFLMAVSILGFQNLSYRAKIKKQGDLVSQIHELEFGLNAVTGSEVEVTAEKSKLVHKLLAAEHQLLHIREKLRIPDRAPTYSLALGKDVHQVLEELGKKDFIIPETFIKSVQEQINYFCMPANRSTLITGFARKPIYESLIRQELARMKIPGAFFYIAMQESLLDSVAQSGKDARGLWLPVNLTSMYPKTGKRCPKVRMSGLGHSCLRAPQSSTCTSSIPNSVMPLWLWRPTMPEEVECVEFCRKSKIQLRIGISGICIAWDG
jgi:hypothetical protein